VVERTAYRGGHTRSWVTLGGRRIAIERPRARAVQAGELALPSFAWAAHEDPLNAATLAAMTARVSTRRYQRTIDPLPAGAAQAAVSRSAVARRFVALSAERLRQWLSGRIEVAAPVVMIDGVHFEERVVRVDLGFDAQGKKHVQGLREGSTEKAAVVRALLSELIDRGLDPDAPRLWVIDGAKALRHALAETFGETALVQRRQEHQRRNVLDHLPEALHSSAGRALRDAWDTPDAILAQRQFKRLANSLRKNHPGAAASLREGLAETLTLIHLGIEEAFYRRLRTTNPIENLNGLIAHYTRNVKRSRDGQMVLRWIGTALHEARRGFRAVRGYRDLKLLTSALAQRARSAFDVQSKVALHARAYSDEADKVPAHVPG